MAKVVGGDGYCIDSEGDLIKVHRIEFLLYFE